MAMSKQNKPRNFRMPCTFAEFKKRCAQQGLTEVEDQTDPSHRNPMSIYAVWVPTATGGRVKCEIKPRRYTLGYGLGKNVSVLRDYLTDTGYECSEGTGYFSIDYVGEPSTEQIFSDFFKLISDVRDVEGIIERSRSQARKVFTKEQAESNIFEKIAKRYRFAIDNEDQGLLDLSRNLLEGDAIDHLITIGESQNRAPTNTYREHIVPCVLLHNHVIDLTLQGVPYTEVAQVIKENLAIVLITNEEADLLDNKLGLKTTMPEGWEFGDSVFARLETAGIKLK